MLSKSAQLSKVMLSDEHYVEIVSIEHRSVQRARTDFMIINRNLDRESVSIAERSNDGTIEDMEDLHRQSIIMREEMPDAEVALAKALILSLIHISEPTRPY